MTQARAEWRKGKLRCARCGDVIGVYEPLVVVTDGVVRRTSRAAEPQIAAKVGDFYHEGCYEARRYLFSVAVAEILAGAG